MNAAVFALIAYVTLELARQTIADPFTPTWHPFAAAICVSVGVALSVFNVNVTWVILAAAAIGLARGAV